MFWNKYPYTDFHELNLDTILHHVQELSIKVDNLVKGGLDKYVEEYFNKYMCQAIYNEQLHRITLKNKLIVGDGLHVYNAGTETISIEEERR